MVALDVKILQKILTKIDGFVVDIMNPGDGLDLGQLVRSYLRHRLRHVREVPLQKSGFEVGLKRLPLAWLLPVAVKRPGQDLLKEFMLCSFKELSDFLKILSILSDCLKNLNSVYLRKILYRKGPCMLLAG